LTPDIKNVLTKKAKLFNSQLNSTVKYLPIPSWVADLEEYYSVIDQINDYYKKMLEIGKCQQVFRPENNQVPELLSAKSKDEFLKAKKNIQLCYTRYVQTGAPRLKISCVAELLPNPKKYLENTLCPTNRMIVVNEQILEHEFNTNNLNILKCDTCV
jgi:hypothetical protein